MRCQPEREIAGCRPRRPRWASLDGEINVNHTGKTRSRRALLNFLTTGARPACGEPKPGSEATGATSREEKGSGRAGEPAHEQQHR